MFFFFSPNNSEYCKASDRYVLAEEPPLSTKKRREYTKRGGGQNTSKFKFELAPKLIPFCWLSCFLKNIKLIFLAHQEVFPLDTTFYILYTKEIPQKTKEILGQCIFHFLPLKTIVETF